MNQTVVKRLQAFTQIFRNQMLAMNGAMCNQHVNTFEVGYEDLYHPIITGAAFVSACF